MPAPAPALVYHFCRLRLPFVGVSAGEFERHLRRAFELFRAKQAKAGATADWDAFLRDLHAIDFFLVCACLDGDRKGWEALFAARATRSDCLLIDALRARAVRLFPRDEGRQESAVTEFWGFLLVGDKEGSVPVLARFDGQRPLVPWLIRVFQNRHLSELRHAHDTLQLPDDDVDDRNLPPPGNGDGHWHEEFRLAAREWMADLSDQEVLLLGLRLRYRLSQREAAQLLGIHEGNVSRQTDRLRDRCLDRIGRRLIELGWTGDDLSGFVLKEMDGLLLDEPRLAADRLAALLAARSTPRPVEPVNPAGETGRQGA